MWQPLFKHQSRPGGYEGRKESEMKGSEKQVRWATEILEEAEASLNAMLKSYNDLKATGERLGDPGLVDTSEYIPEDVEAVREVLRKAPDNASVIIDNRKRLTYDGLKKRVLAHARLRKEGK
jgi:hypothetical protein